MKDHEIRDCISAIVAVAQQYHHTEQLRERIKYAAAPLMDAASEHHDDDVRSRHELIADLVAANKRIFDLETALNAYVGAGFGNSTDLHKQGAAYDLAIEALAGPARKETADGIQEP